MIPLRDTIPSRTTPFVNYALIVINSLIFIYELLLGRGLGEFIFNYGLVPARFVAVFGIEDLSIWYAIYPFFTSMFLHGGWLHVIGNMWFLYIFGDNVEDRLGHVKYAFFYIICGLAAGMSQLILSLHSKVPMIGASGAIAGILGAYMLLFPHARILTVIPIFIFFIVEIPAFIFLILWFIIQFLQGALSLASVSEGGVAWWAHIGGFAAGIVIIKVYLKRQRRNVHRGSWIEF